MKFWYVSCWLLFVHSIISLINERYDVIYHLEDTENDRFKNDQDFAKVPCSSLGKIFKNKTQIQLESLHKDLIYYFKSKTYYSLIGKEDENRRLIIRIIKSRGYFIFKDSLCFKINENMHAVELALNFDNQRFFAINERTLQYSELPSYLNKIHHLKVLNLEYPYSNCSKSSSYFKCLNDCAKKLLKLSKYYYGSNEVGSIYLKYQENASVSEKEKACSMECEMQGYNCEIENFIYIKENEKDEREFEVFQASSLITNFEFYIQIIGLAFFFTNMHLLKLIHIFIRFIRLKIKRTKVVKIRKNKIEKFIRILGFAVLFLVLVFAIVSNISMILGHFDRQDNPIIREIKIPYKSEPFKLVFCLDLEDIYYSGRNTTLLDLEKNRATRKNKKRKNKKRKNIIWIKFHYLFKPFRTRVFFNESKIVFKCDSYCKTNIKRCFQFEIYPYEMLYQSMIAMSKLIIKSSEFYYQFYYLQANEELNFNSFEVDTRSFFVKKIIKRSRMSKEECLDYEKVYKSCTSRSNCILECIHKRFIEDRTVSFIPGSIVNKDLLTNEIWNNVFINYDHQYYNKTKIGCESKYRKKDCNEEFFENAEEYPAVLDIDSPYFTELNLPHYVISLIEEEQSVYKLLLDILNILSILFGINLMKLFSWLFYLKKLKFRCYKLFVYFFCLLAFSYNTWSIFENIVNNDLIYSQYFKIEDSMFMNEFIFCLPIDKRINSNYKFTNEYLDQKTKNLELKDILVSVTYLNSKDQFITLNKTNFDSNFYIEQEVSLSTFYFLDLKCLKIRNEIEYFRDKFYFRDDNRILSICFENEMIYYPSSNWFFTKIKDTMHFSKTLHLESDGLAQEHTLTQELFEIEYDDKFNLIKNPLSIFGQNNLNDINAYLSGLVSNFRKIYKLETLNLPIERSDQNLEISNNLFDQYFMIQNETDHRWPSNMNYKRTFLINHIDRFLQKSTFADLSLNLQFLKKFMKITNEDNYSKLILSLLNVLSFSFDKSILDLSMYFQMLIQGFNFLAIFICKFVLKIEYYLCKNGYYF